MTIYVVMQIFFNKNDYFFRQSPPCPPKEGLHTAGANLKSMLFILRTKVHILMISFNHGLKAVVITLSPDRALALTLINPLHGVGGELDNRFFTNFDEKFSNQNKSYYEKECFSLNGTNCHDDFIDACFWPEG